MKLLHYCKVLLFSVPLNILVHNKNKSYITPQNTRNTRLLCECELYTSIYDNDTEMKAVMGNYNQQTSQRFEEYNKRMNKNRQKCKDECDKEIQKIILKDKLQKELMHKFATLHTDIQSDAIPTCVCEKSLADKVEKTCLRCTQNLGGIVAPSSGVLAGIAEGALIVWKPAAIKAAKAAAAKAASDAATQAGIEAVRLEINKLSVYFNGTTGFVDLTPIVTSSTYDNGLVLVECAKKLIGDLSSNGRGGYTGFYNTAIHTESGELYVGNFGGIGKAAHDAKLASETTALTEAKVGAVDTTYGGFQTYITASVIAIVVIILIMVIIYLILRYRRKKKNEEKTPVHKIIRRINIMCLAFFIDIFVYEILLV
ncbi:hypothetical protein PFTANZ_02718 [Plasmodium falciparum Tanzania (2000708)]|uniref:Surface antigen n=1 Tax=Plasmodium falciparum Tanzania (2000708) TaxID=1036725 RepID=A0A024W6Q4_PLAFA|nr:hypothetical protein PFTANZ_02718 [Plasmodium falciparum Tanzania (2000708)]